MNHLWLWQDNFVWEISVFRPLKTFASEPKSGII
jgi:hypothetical protein